MKKLIFIFLLFPCLLFSQVTKTVGDEVSFKLAITSDDIIGIESIMIYDNEYLEYIGNIRDLTVLDHQNISNPDSNSIAITATKSDGIPFVFDKQVICTFRFRCIKKGEASLIFAQGIMYDIASNELPNVTMKDSDNVIINALNEFFIIIE